MNKTERKSHLLPEGKPRWIRCYDNGGETLDRYTVVFTGNYTSKTGGQRWSLLMNSAPFEGIGMHCSDLNIIDRPTYGHLGRKIGFDDLPPDCQQLVLQDYVYLWDITDHALYRED